MLILHRAGLIDVTYALQHDLWRAGLQFIRCDGCNRSPTPNDRQAELFLQILIERSVGEVRGCQCRAQILRDETGLQLHGGIMDGMRPLDFDRQ